MALIFDYYSTGQTVSGGNTTTFNSTMIPSTGLTSISFAMTGANNTLANIARIRVKANGQTIYDTTPDFLRAFIQRRTNGIVCYPRNAALDQLGSAGVGQSFRRFTIPFLDLAAPTPDMAERCQFPRGANITVELQFGAGASSGLCFIGYSQSDQAAECYPKLISQPMNCNVSQTNYRYNFSDEGIVRAFGLNSLGLSRARLVLAGAQVFHCFGSATANGTDLTDSLFVEMQQLWNRTTDMQAASAGVPVTFYDPYVQNLDTALVAPSGNSYVELATGTNWGGATPTSNELLIYSQVRQ